MRKLIWGLAVPAVVAAGVVALQAPAQAWVTDHCADAAEVCLYEHENYGGRVLNFFGPIDNLGNFDFNDTATSSRVRVNYCFYEHVQGGGAHVFLDQPNPNPNFGEIWNDRISSAYRCTGGTTAYTALGDSASSGVGAPPYDLSSGCQRSSRSTPALWTAGHPGTSFRFVACTGATTTDVLNFQLANLISATTQVTITVGSSDAGFTSVLSTCLTGTDAACLVAVQQAEGYATTILPSALDRTYAAIRVRAPRARLIVLGYPRLFELTASCPSSGMSYYKRGLLNHAADILDQVILTQAAAAGGTFVDVRPAFAGHGVCSSSPWIHALTSPISDSFHPTSTGYSQGYLPALLNVTG